MTAHVTQRTSHGSLLFLRAIMQRRALIQVATWEILVLRAIGEVTEALALTFLSASALWRRGSTSPRLSVPGLCESLYGAWALSSRSPRLCIPSHDSRFKIA